MSVCVLTPGLGIGVLVGSERLCLPALAYAVYVVVCLVADGLGGMLTGGCIPMSACVLTPGLGIGVLMGSGRLLRVGCTKRTKKFLEGDLAIQQARR